tara:strand:+ start:194 stop:439 length:246 start_codon:yes stop_codon:yes gene_type:complete
MANHREKLTNAITNRKQVQSLGIVRDNVDVAVLNDQFLSYYRNILDDSLLDHLGQYCIAISNKELIEDVMNNNYNPEIKYP